MSEYAKRTRFATGFFLLLVVIATLSGCSKQPEAEVVVVTDPAPVGTTTKYDWYMQGDTPAGQTTITSTGDGRITNDTFVHWNNREYSLESEVQLDSNGVVVSQRMTGISAFKAPIDESFAFEDGVATWSTAGDSGSAQIDEPGFYIDNEWGSFETVPALVRAAQRSIDGEVPLLPSGTARVKPIQVVEITTPGGPRTASLYAISGISFTPSYIWLDEQGEVLGLDMGGYLGMVPEGWDTAALATLSEAQTRASADYAESATSGLARDLDGPVIFENVGVVDVEAGELLEDYFVMVEGGKITAVSNLPLEAEGAIRVDGAGKSLMPGMWDMHGHFGLEHGVLNIAGGITSVRIIGGVHDKIMEMTEKFESGAVIGPKTYRAGFIDKSGPYASGWSADNLEDILDRVDFFAEHGYLQIKLYSSIEPEWVAPIAERAHGHGMRLSGHIPAFMSAEEAVRAGYDEIQHINMVFLNFIEDGRADTRQQLRFSLYGEQAADIDLDSDEVEAFIELLKDRNIVIDPTAAIFEEMLVHVAGEPNPTFATVIDHLPPAIARPMYSPAFPHGEAWARSNDNQSKMLKKLFDNGVQLVPGSDNIAAFTIHRELEVYVEAGIPEAAALRMATLDSARIVGVDDRTGSIAVGKDADLILLDGNPLNDISAVRRATLVMKGDKAYRPDELYKVVGVKPFLDSTEI